MKKKSRKKLSGIVIAAAVAMAVAGSCAFPFQGTEQGVITDISANLDFMTVSRQGFMGGSVLYNPGQPSSGQLDKGVSVAVRLGYVSREEVGSGQVVFSNIQEKAQYGSLVVTDIGEARIDFTTKIYTVDGVLIQEGVHSLALDSRADINGDGLADLEYKKPAQKREGFENAVYLTFLSSQETCNTAMFAVLQEQYSRSVYPSGIIGINPNGQFIFSKYEGATSNRAAVAGVVRGDYVLDGVAGKYQRVVKAAAGRGARAVSDDETADIESVPDEAAFLFKASDFSDGYSAEALFAALPGTVTDGLPYDEDTVSKINTVIKMRDLIRHIALSQGADANDAEIENTIAGLSDTEIIRFNRTGLAEIYPAICPPFFNPDSGFVEAVPLASIIIGGDEEGIGDNTGKNNSRAASIPTYNAEKSAINSKFNSYSVVYSTSYGGLPNNSYVTLKTPPTLKLGVKGIFDNSWGNIYGGLSAVTYLSMETEVHFSKSFSYSQNLLPALSYYRSVYVPGGPVPLFVTTDMGIKLPLDVQASTESDLYLYYTGMYGGTGIVGINYGVTWKKVLFISLPFPYFSPYADGNKISETAYFMEGKTTNIATLALTPTVYASVGLSIAGVVGTDLGAEAALQAKMNVILKANSTTGENVASGTGNITLYPSVYIEPWVGFSVPLIGWRGYSKRIDVYKATVPIKAWTMF